MMQIHDKLRLALLATLSLAAFAAPAAAQNYAPVQYGQPAYAQPMPQAYAAPQQPVTTDAVPAMNAPQQYPQYAQADYAATNYPAPPSQYVAYPQAQPVAPQAAQPMPAYRNYKPDYLDGPRPNSESSEKWNDFRRDWLITVGGGLLVKPEYEGGGTYEIVARPDVDIRYKDWFVANFREGVSASVYRNDGLSVGPIVKWIWGRDEDDADDLRGMGDVDGSLEVGAFLKYQYEDFLMSYEIRQDVIGGHDGMVMDFAAGLMGRFGDNNRWNYYVGPKLTWASGAYMRSYFGVDTLQSARSGYAMYRPGSGLKDVSFGGRLRYMFDQHFSATGLISYKHLLEEAGDSPIAKEDSAVIFGLFGGYTF